MAAPLVSLNASTSSALARPSLLILCILDTVTPPAGKGIESLNTVQRHCRSHVLAYPMRDRLRHWAAQRRCGGQGDTTPVRREYGIQCDYMRCSAFLWACYRRQRFKREFQRAVIGTVTRSLLRPWLMPPREYQLDEHALPQDLPVQFVSHRAREPPSRWLTLRGLCSHSGAPQRWRPHYVLIATPKSSFLDSATFCVSNRGLVETSQLSEFQWNSLCMMPWLCRGSCPLWVKSRHSRSAAARIHSG